MSFDDVCYIIHAAVAYFNKISIEDFVQRFVGRQVLLQAPELIFQRLFERLLSRVD